MASASIPAKIARALRLRQALRLAGGYWLPAVLLVGGILLIVAFVYLLPNKAISWNDKGNIGQFFKGFITSITMLVFSLTIWMQIREIPGQTEQMAQTRQDMVRQTDFLQQQWSLQKEQLHQLNIQEVLANVRVLAANVEERAGPGGATVEVWRSQAITELTQASLLLLRKHSLPALHGLCRSDRPILTAFGSETIRAVKSNLRGAQLQGANLEGVMLDNAFLVDADLSGANLRNAVLLGSNLLQADLTDANLDGADLTGAHLMGANLTRANLLGANVIEVNLLGANLESAVLAGADLSLALVDPRWRPAIERSGARNVDKVHWGNTRLKAKTA
ncbi:MAG: pentapeptide repeat-containing protein [SAR324 cluster bacterium]